MTELTELEELEAELFVANARADFMANARVMADYKAWSWAGAKAEVSRIEAEIEALKEQDND
jgi:Tfp pilus assembly protein PilV